MARTTLAETNARNLFEPLKLCCISFRDNYIYLYSNAIAITCEMTLVDRVCLG